MNKILNYINPFSKQAISQFKSLKKREQTVAIGVALLAAAVPLLLPSIITFRAIVIRYSKISRENNNTILKIEAIASRISSAATADSTPSHLADTKIDAEEKKPSKLENEKNEPYFESSDVVISDKLKHSDEFFKYCIGIQDEYPRDLEGRNVTLRSLLRFFKTVEESTLEKNYGMNFIQIAKSIFEFTFIKKIGHIFALQGQINVDGRGNFNFEGNSTKQSYRYFHLSLTHFLLFHKSTTSEEQRKNSLKIADQIKRGERNIVEGASQKKIEEVIQNCLNEYQRGEPLILPTGWEGHAINIVIHGRYLSITNRGQRNNKSANTRIFEIPDTTKIDAKLLEMIVNTSQGTNDSRMTYFNKGMENELGLKKINEFKAASQKSGNCTYANNKLSYKCLLLLQSLNNEEDEKQAYSEAHASYKQWSYFDRLESLYELKECIEHVGLDALGAEATKTIYLKARKKIIEYWKKNNKATNSMENPENLIHEIDALLKIGAL